ncbi:hypothetical protein HNP84_005454 [Thermocatellispora tengchongensis]|uniref:Uncharacterized protein n=1 Tax=Thermocatellispora tengchongensis TaxID=1073253 RepID=A0A840PE37_9ACTN|nr:hypothetical protein [Thermocatellispora tengchongensis]MBB5135710.1 hypothetical protein [Thermocatellispora tengchongensis]
MTISLLLPLSVIVWAIVFSIPAARRLFGRHRVWVALTVLPLQPLVLVALVDGLSSGDGAEAQDVTLNVLAYVNGLVAFGLVTGVQAALRPEPAGDGRHRASAVWGTTAAVAAALAVLLVLAGLPLVLTALAVVVVLAAGAGVAALGGRRGR